MWSAFVAHAEYCKRERRVGRDAGIRTRDLLHPKQARYQATLHPVRQSAVNSRQLRVYFLAFALAMGFFFAATGAGGGTRRNSS